MIAFNYNNCRVLHIIDFRWYYSMLSIFKCDVKKYDEIEPNEAFIIIEKKANKSNFIILDVRTLNEYKEEHLESAQLLNVKSTYFIDELDRMDKNKKYFVYCRRGKRGRIAVNLMKKQGYIDVHNITGGINKWKSKKLPVK
jgi:rhodanese-related sulfurtransferase